MATTRYDERRLTWRELAKLEPGLRILLQEVLATRTEPGYCANRHWLFQGLKARLAQLVGWGRPDHHPVLSTSEAYDLAYRKIYDRLPHCRHGGMFC